MAKRRARIVIVGAGGRLGAALTRIYGPSHEVTGLNHEQLDLSDAQRLRTALSDCSFDVLINAAALTNVDYCEDHRAEAMRLNAEAPREMAELCRQRSARFVHISTDYVFDGEKHTPYTEEDAAKPISVYGESKRAGEVEVLQANDCALVVRVSWVFGPDRPSFVDAILKRARETQEVAAVADKFSTPTYTADIAEGLRPLLGDDSIAGILHLANQGACSWQEYAQWALDCCHRNGLRMKARSVAALSLGQMKNFVARRPVYTVLATERYAQLTGTARRDWHEAVAQYIRDYYCP